MSIQVNNINNSSTIHQAAKSNTSLQVLQGYQNDLNSGDTVSFKGERWNAFKEWASKNRKPLVGVGVVGAGTGTYFAVKAAAAPAAGSAAAPAAAKGGAAAAAAVGKGLPIITPLYKGIGVLGKTIGVGLGSMGKAIGLGAKNIVFATGKTVGLTAWSAIKIPINILGSL